MTKRRDAFRGGPVYGYREPRFDVLVKRIRDQVQKAGDAWCDAFSEFRKKQNERAMFSADVLYPEKLYTAIELAVTHYYREYRNSDWKYARAAHATVLIWNEDRSVSIEKSDYGFPREILKAFER